MRIYQIFLLLLSSAILISCGVVQNYQQQAEAKQIVDEMKRCIQQSSKSNYSRCAYNLNQNIKNRISDSDPFKSAGLIYTTKLYVLLSNYEKNKISQEDLKIGLMRADSDLQRDMEAMERANAESRRQQAIYQQQMFNNAAQLLRGDGGGQVNCYSTPGVPNSFYCR
jgi:hypothetical protein